MVCQLALPTGRIEASHKHASHCFAQRDILSHYPQFLQSAKRSANALAAVGRAVTIQVLAPSGGAERTFASGGTVTVFVAIAAAG